MKWSLLLHFTGRTYCMSLNLWRNCLSHHDRWSRYRMRVISIGYLMNTYYTCLIWSRYQSPVICEQTCTNPHALFWVYYIELQLHMFEYDSMDFLYAMHPHLSVPLCIWFGYITSGFILYFIRPSLYFNSIASSCSHSYLEPTGTKQCG